MGHIEFFGIKFVGFSMHDSQNNGNALGNGKTTSTKHMRMIVTFNINKN